MHNMAHIQGDGGVNRVGELHPKNPQVKILTGGGASVHNINRTVVHPRVGEQQVGVAPHPVRVLQNPVKIAFPHVLKAARYRVVVRLKYTYRCAGVGGAYHEPGADLGGAFSTALLVAGLRM